MPFFKHNGTCIYYEDEGTGPAIVLIHPPLVPSRIFDYQMEQLKSRYRVIRFDIRGHGLSDPSFQPLTYWLVVQDLLHLLDRLDIKQAYLAGYSTGGSIVLEALLQEPDRFSGGILICAMSEVSDPLLKTGLNLAVSLCNSTGFPFLARVICWANADCLSMFRHLLQTARLGNTENIRQYFTYSKIYNCTRQLASISHPVLILFGTKNKQYEKYTQLLKTHLPNSFYSPVANKPHHLPTKAPQEVNWRIQQWIESLQR
ncbi:alpha/beta fold hydrolase [Thermoactinomyces mirandus]|uniref:Alpha/beta hydrolase n=1 Tax=Thermoactinomyces mirandus TaxID=2756294 RepID=A0A7W1XRY7_9BACL|nr:alpha/beta hydrolase [Thermoactinomyces mirandus]MBA4602193.1 alpha/beta hydrolase [Thermoactinomyces mirandus]